MISLPFLHRFSAVGLLLTRVLVGIIFVAHGIQKIAIGPASIAQFFGSVGIPVPTLTAYTLTVLEVVGGALLVLGLASRLVAILFALEMLGAILTLHIHIGFITPSPAPAPGAEFPAAVIAALIAVVLVGPGQFSLDARMRLETAASGEKRLMQTD